MAHHARTREPLPRRVVFRVDLVCVSQNGSSLVVLLVPDGRRAWRLPGAPWRSGLDLTGAAVSLTRTTVGRQPSWCEQSGVFVTDVPRGGAEVSATFVSVLRRDTPIPPDAGWHDVAKLPAALGRQFTRAIAAAVVHVRRRMNQVPIAFHLLPATFALGELQDVYQVLLGRRVHKASFRRALRAAALVEPTQKWRSDGRGRPAQLYRFAPNVHRAAKRPVRFDLIDD